MESLREGMDPSTVGRVKFTGEEVETIKMYYEAEIEANKVPPVERCWEFLCAHPLSRGLKQIRDKFRNLIKNKQ